MLVGTGRAGEPGSCNAGAGRGGGTGAADKDMPGAASAGAAEDLAAIGSGIAIAEAAVPAATARVSSVIGSGDTGAGAFRARISIGGAAIGGGAVKISGAATSRSCQPSPAAVSKATPATSPIHGFRTIAPGRSTARRAGDGDTLRGGKIGAVAADTAGGMTVAGGRATGGGVTGSLATGSGIGGGASVALGGSGTAFGDAGTAFGGSGTAFGGSGTAFGGLRRVSGNGFGGSPAAGGDLTPAGTTRSRLPSHGPVSIRPSSSARCRRQSSLSGMSFPLCPET
ncbi:hypothetical protein GCM10011529_16580 [Polymorphobacter glacialis]|uniref:Uncharacterized protein n=1 Tax=Sandarakinorhabdus glacialis TaxID=1614636 RepID=A0A917E8Y0_9SPHN|nr:hypothetical protein GCM10011529_16580 [Polymorphobacter glacialis]